MAKLSMAEVVKPIFSSRRDMNPGGAANGSRGFEVEAVAVPEEASGARSQTFEAVSSPRFEFETCMLKAETPLSLSYVRDSGRIRLRWDPQHVSRDQTDMLLALCAIDAGLGSEDPNVPAMEPYVPPTDPDHAAAIRTAGAGGAILKAYLFVDEDEEAPDEPRIAIYSESGTDDELDLAGTDQLIADLLAFTTELRAMRSVLAVGPLKTAPQDQAALPVERAWTLTTNNGVRAHGYLPQWADHDPSEDNLSFSQLRLRATDVTHTKYFPGQPMTVNAPDEGGREIYEEEVFRPQISCRPSDDDPAEQMPHATVTVVEDHIIEHLDPQGVTDLATKLRAQASRLDQVSRELAVARADWATKVQAHS